jgi:trehalose/maltose hydrolase-like predicted phosphorylase
VFRTIATLVSQPYSPDPHLEAIRLARWGEMLGFETLRSDNRDAWKALWKSRIRIDGNTDDQRGIDAAFYYYHSSIHPSTLSGIPPFGLAQHDRYFGHVFWDMDMWMLIPAILTAPASARAMLDYRARGLEAARRKASLFGYRGAQYPWEASLDGWEVTPSCCPTGWAEQHVTPGAAIGAWECQRALGDEDTLRAETWPILESVAEWIESRGRFTDRGFEIGHMMGPDEGITDLSNQTYFNLLSKMALSAAIDCSRMVGMKPLGAWQRIRDRIVIPRDPTTGVVLPFDVTSRVRVYDPNTRSLEERDASASLETYSLGNLQFLFLHGCPVDERTFRATWQREEEVRRERMASGVVPSLADLPGFTTGPFAVCAAHFGERRKAAELFTAAWKPFWMEPFGLTRECRSHTWGGFVTNNGSLLQSVLLGFTGLRIGNGLEPRYPACLPEGWERIEVDCLWSRGRAMRLTARHGPRAALAPAEG